MRAILAVLALLALAGCDRATTAESTLSGHWYGEFTAMDISISGASVDGNMTRLGRSFAISGYWQNASLAVAGVDSVYGPLAITLVAVGDSVLVGGAATHGAPRFPLMLRRLPAAYR